MKSSIINDENFDKDKVLEIVKENFNYPDNILILLSEKNIEELQKIINENPIFMSKVIKMSTAKIWNLFAVWNNIKNEHIWEKEYIISRNNEWYITGVFEKDGSVITFTQIAIQYKAEDIKYRINWFVFISEKWSSIKKAYIMKEWKLVELDFNKIIAWDKWESYRIEELHDSVELINAWNDVNEVKELTKDWIKIRIDNWKWQSYYYNTMLNKWYLADSCAISFLKKWILKLNIRNDKRYEKIIDLKTWEETEMPKE